MFYRFLSYFAFKNYIIKIQYFHDINDNINDKKIIFIHKIFYIIYYLLFFRIRY